VIVVDNNSGDGMIDSFSNDYPDAIFIRNGKNGGFAYGCNIGADRATGKYLLFLNPDTIADEEALSSLIRRAIETLSDFIISCRQIDDYGGESTACGEFLTPGKLTGLLRAINRFRRRITGTEKMISGTNPFKPDWVSGSVLMINRRFYDRLGGFDENFWMYFEDMDLCRRARTLGGEILYFNDISIHHKHGGSSRIDIHTTALTKTEVLISKHLYVSKHFSPARFFSQLFLVVNNLVSGLLSAVAGIVLFFIPALYVRLNVFYRLAGYYSGAMKRGSWISPRSVKSE
jgi:GT2 family glycosyltransferase